MIGPTLRIALLRMGACVAVGCALGTQGVRAETDPATFLSITSANYQSSQYLDDKGQKHQSSCVFQQTSTSIYAQHRFGAHAGWFADTAYNTETCGGGTTRGLTDIEIGATHSLGSKIVAPFGLRGSLIVPSNYSLQANPRLGIGRPAAQLGVTYLSGFRTDRMHYGFVNGGVGVRAYTGYPAPQLETNLTVGLNLSKRVAVYEGYYGTTHLGAGGTPVQVGLNPIVSARYDSYQLASNLVVKVAPGVSLSVSAWNQLGGRTVGLGQTLSTGLWAKF